MMIPSSGWVSAYFPMYEYESINLQFNVDCMMKMNVEECKMKFLFVWKI